MKPKPILFNLFVSNLSYKARAKSLKEFLISEGFNVYSAEIVFQDNPRRSSGYGFVSFKSKKEVDAALVALQGKVITQANYLCELIDYSIFVHFCIFAVGYWMVILR